MIKLLSIKPQKLSLFRNQMAKRIIFNILIGIAMVIFTVLALNGDFTHAFQYFYVPAHGPFYEGNVWGNAFVILVLAPLGFVWSKMKFWPLKGLEADVQELHRLHHEHAAAVTASL